MVLVLIDEGESKKCVRRDAWYIFTTCTATVSQGVALSRHFV
jgi:hypothetical protein